MAKAITTKSGSSSKVVMSSSTSTSSSSFCFSSQKANNNKKNLNLNENPTSLAIVLIPFNDAQPLVTYHIPWNTKWNVNSPQFSSKIHHRIVMLLHRNSPTTSSSTTTTDTDNDNDNDDTDNDDDDDDDVDLAQIDDRVEVPLLRPSVRNDTNNSTTTYAPGLYAYYRSSSSVGVSSSEHQHQPRPPPNIRATRLAMACGLFATRLYGPVVITRRQTVSFPLWRDVTTEQLYGPCELSPDLRSQTLQTRMRTQLQPQPQPQPQHNSNNNKEERKTMGYNNNRHTIAVPLWIQNAAQQNYHDAAVVARMAEVMKQKKDNKKKEKNKMKRNVVLEEEKGNDTDTDTDNDNGDDDDDASTQPSDDDGPSTATADVIASSSSSSSSCKQNATSMNTVTAKSPLCLHCRKPTTNLCEGCFGAYFCCPPQHTATTTMCASGSSTASSTRIDLREPNNDDDWLSCSRLGWSHLCQCSTWKLYVARRTVLSSFQYLDANWQQHLVQRECQISEKPYQFFLSGRLSVIRNDNDNDNNNNNNFSSWWRTETDGWMGGESDSAQQIDITIRRSYQEGFNPVPVEQLPPMQRVEDTDYERILGPSDRFKDENTETEEEKNKTTKKKNAVGLWKVTSWEEYYRLRSLPSTSPVALLCTFPLTIYHAIVEYGTVPVTVARMLHRPLRIHVVGTEKELHFLDLFQELGYLLPEDLKVELIFVAREDMLPKKCRRRRRRTASGTTKSDDDGSDNATRCLLKIDLTTNLTVSVVGGTYGDSTSVDPEFDCGSGPPDMIVGMNAGLYAYESWRSVVEYLSFHPHVVGVFTDYNEYSGVHCASLGGASARESLCINPFRQPLALPVYSMNLPQFSNGFMYVFNEQTLDE